MKPEPDCSLLQVTYHRDYSFKQDMDDMYADLLMYYRYLVPVFILMNFAS
jgi:hypothetical protein